AAEVEGAGHLEDPAADPLPGVVGVLAAASVLRWVLADGGNVIFTLVFSFIASVAMEPAVAWLSQHMSRGKAALLVMVGVGLAGLVFLVAFGRLLGEQIATFATTLPDLAQSAVTWVNQRFGASISYQDVLDKLGLGAGTLTSVATSVAGGLLGFVIQVLSAAFGTLTFAFFTFYFSADAPRLRNWMAQLFPPDRQEIIDTVWSLSVRKTGGYVAARLVLAAVCGGTAAIFMLIIGMPYWLALGIWTGVVAQFVPTVGTYIAIALPVLIGLVGPQPWQGVAVLAFALVYQQIENVTLEPRISASAVDVHPAVSFAAVMFGASLFGVGGAFVAVPMAALMLALFDIYANKYEVAELDDAVFAPPEGDESDADEAAAREAREA
ncbi:MAG TPA: AI-2E family transporter, partial [Dermatophilaceae bacterium]|nr:AI-2E family transporter [Dermatophilaceae bacterium]